MNEFNFQLEPLRAIIFQIGVFLPRLLVAAVVVVVGWMIAKLVRVAVARVLRAVNFNVLTERSGLDGFLRQGGVGKDTSDLLGILAYWIVILATLIIAFNGLGLTYITDLLGRVVWFVPNIIVALLVLAFGAYFARFVGDAVTTYGRNVKMSEARFFGKLAQYAVMLFVILIALDQVRVGGDIVRQSFIVILTGVVFAFALAFGLAGKDWAADRIASWWPRDSRGELRGDPLGEPRGEAGTEQGREVLRETIEAPGRVAPQPPQPQPQPQPPRGVPAEPDVPPAGEMPHEGEVAGDVLPPPVRRGPLMPNRPSDPPPPI